MPLDKKIKILEKFFGGIVRKGERGATLSEKIVSTSLEWLE
jgi:hypothetical protein